MARNLGKNLIIGFISLTFMLPLTYWMFNIFDSTAYFQVIPFGSYFLIGGMVGFLFTVLYYLIFKKK